MLYRRTPELPPLKSIVNGVIQEPGIFPEITGQTEATISAGELFLKALWLETSITKDNECYFPATGPATEASGVRTIVSRKYNPNVAFKSGLGEICAIYAKINDLSSDTISSNYIETSSMIANVVETNNLLDVSADISVLNSDEISTDKLSANNGQIKNISGDNISHYTSGTINELSSHEISTKNITAYGVALLTAAATYWADLAELYRSETSLEPGTLVKFNGENEIEIASNGVANGVVSKNPAFLMNSSLKNKSVSNPIVLVGRSVVKIKDRISKFDRIELSDIPGIAQKASTGNRQILGISLESKPEQEIKPVECIIKLSI